MKMKPFFKQHSGRKTPAAPVGAVLVCLMGAMLLAGCATQDERTTQSEDFMRYWSEKAKNDTGYSLTDYDLDPEPRVVMTQRDTAGVMAIKKLPDAPVSIRVQNVPVSTVLRSLASSARVSLVVSPLVQGRVSLNVRNEKWSDVFESVLRSAALCWSWQGNILQVLTPEEQKREIERITMENQLSEQKLVAGHNGPTSVRIVNVRFAEAADLKKSLEKIIARNKDAVIELDQHNNALVVQASEPEQRRVLALIDSLDRPRAQVMLKAYIVETTKEKARELGMQWGGLGKFGGTRNTTWIGSGQAAGTVADGAISLSGGTSLTGAPMGLNYSSIVNGTGAGNLALAFGRIGGNILETQLNLMEKDGVLNILSSPSLTTLDNKMAFTENGEKVPYVSTDGDGDTNVNFEEAVLRLEMTPNVIDRNNLKLKIAIKKDEVDSSRAVQGNPYIIKKETQTTVMVKSGETIVISGLTKERRNDIDAGVPGLSKLPGGKYLFGSTNHTSSMEEVLIFITPVILPSRIRAAAQPDGGTAPVSVAPVMTP